MNVQPGMLAKKLGMTQLFLEDGTRIPVTVLQVKGNTVTAHRTAERDGYSALQVGFADQKPARLSKAALGHFAKGGVAPKKHVREFRVDAAELEKFPVGSELPVLFEQGAVVDVSGTTKGKGFQGVMKRHGMRGKPSSHGVHEYFRHGGSIGCRLTPGRVLPGKRMGGHMGHVTKTVQNLEVAKVLADEGVVLVRGAVPGPTDGIVALRPARKVTIRKAHGTYRRKTKAEA